MGPSAAGAGVGAPTGQQRSRLGRLQGLFYAAFHGLTACFAVRVQTFSKHSAIRAAMHRDLVQADLLGQDAARDYDFLLELRETGDYGGATSVTPDDAQLAVEKAEHFVAAIKKLCP